MRGAFIRIFTYLRALLRLYYTFFFFNDTATTEIYTLSLHDALPIWNGAAASGRISIVNNSLSGTGTRCATRRNGDRKSTRLNSSHGYISYAVFCLKKKKKNV